ncbi:adenylyltransferase/cytidyltransferase family protein [Candidatus Nanohaloarchaea archaeon]|nr:adenylyltransferase/cytidyltransferase family protein [Candidatus Nanohaloarchaea archaeon]
MSDKAVLVGRFQPFHQGHREVVEEYIDEHELAIAIGSANEEGSEENPLSFEERKEIIRACYPEIEVVGLEDFDEDEEGNFRWLKELKENTSAEKVISQNNLVKRLVREDGELELVEQDMHEPSIYSGTEVRRRIKSGEEWRYLVPGCAEDRIAEKIEKIKESGIQYEFEPGWEPKNSYHDTYEK